MYHLRITSEDEKYHRFVIQNCAKYFMVLEEADAEVSRTHTHSHVEELFKEEQTVRNALGKLTNGNKGKIFSFKAVKNSRVNNLQYLCKGKDMDTLPIVVLNNFLTESDIYEHHTNYWLVKESLGKKREKKPSFLELCVERALEDKATFGKVVISNNCKRHRMFQLVCQMLGEKAKVLDAMIIRRLCNGVFNIIDPRFFRSDFLFDQVYPEHTKGLES